MKYLFIIVIFLGGSAKCQVSSLIYSSEHEFLRLYQDSTFEIKGSYVASFSYAGIYLIKGDSLYLYRLTPLIVNQTDTVFPHSSHVTEILTKIDSLTFFDNRQTYYKLQKINRK